MTDTYYRTGKINMDHTTFGGRIYNRDFDEYHSISDIVDRIVSDWKFDKKCLKNIESMMRKKRNG